MLSAEPGAHICVASGIFVQHQQGRPVRALIRKFAAGLETAGRNCARRDAEDELSVGWRGGHCRQSRKAGSVHFVFAHSGMVERNANYGEWKATVGSVARPISRRE